MNRILRCPRGVGAGLRRAFSTNADPEYRAVAASVNEQVNRITSLWGMRNIKIKPSQYFGEDLMLRLAAKQLGQTEADDLLRLSPENKAGKLPNAMSSTRIIYEESINRNINFTDNDIWLGYSKYISYLNVSLRYPAENLRYFAHEVEDVCKRPESQPTSPESTAIDINNLDIDECKRVIEEAEGLENYTIFVYPYMRKTSKLIVDTLSRNRRLISETDFRSLIYTCGATGSSRLLRFLGTMMGENFAQTAKSTPIHNVEAQAWPWMCKGQEDGRAVNYNLPLLLDALSACAVIRYALENEANIYDYLMVNLKNLDDRIQQLSEGSEEAHSSEELEALREYDQAVLERVLGLLVIKRNFDQLGNDQIRTFSDFVCDRLHRIRPKVLANVAFSLGHSKSLDEFWMFMISKQIQMIINANMGSQSPEKEKEDRDGSVGVAEDGCQGMAEEASAGLAAVTQTDAPNTMESMEQTNVKTEEVDKFDMDDITAILDAYSTAGLEDYNFYSTICRGIREEFGEYSLHHKSVVIRSLAKVRHRDAELLEDFMEGLRRYISTLNEHQEGRERELGEAHRAGRAPRRGALDSLRSYLIKPIDSYIVASAIVSACDLDFRADDIDPLWKVLTLKVKDSSFDICAISWLPLAVIMFPSVVALTEFLPVWLRHVNYTITKLRSRAYMMTIQRRQLLLRHAFNLGILPEKLLNAKAARVLDEICDRNYITCKEDYIPESSTFHLEVCACLRALGVTHQREINLVPFVMDVVIAPEKVVDIKSSLTAEAERATDLARCGNISVEGDQEAFPLKYTRNSPNHRKRKEEIYTSGPNA